MILLKKKMAQLVLKQLSLTQIMFFLNGKGGRFENFQPWMNIYTSQGSFLWSFITIGPQKIPEENKFPHRIL